MARHCQGHIAQCLGGILARRGGATVAVDSAGHSFSGEEFVDGVRRLAAGLVDRGVRPGDVVAIVGFNSIQYVELFLAVAYVGAIVAPLNYRWSFDEAAQALELVQPTAFVFDGVFSSWAQRLTDSNKCSSIGLYFILGDTCSTVHAAKFVAVDHIKRCVREPTATEPVSAPRDVALICFTSGTTGRPKGVAISHTSLIIQSLAKIAIVGYGEDDGLPARISLPSEQRNYKLQGSSRSSLLSTERNYHAAPRAANTGGETKTQVYLHMAPLCHIGGISSCMAILMAGGCHVLIPKFDAKSAFDAIKEHGVTSFITVPAIMADLLSYARKEMISGPVMTVTKILNGGGGLSEELMDGASRLFPRAAIFSAYGMTEACSSMTFMALNKPKLQEPMNQSGSHSGGICVGKPAPHVDIQIGMDGNNTIPSPTGNILTRGLHTMVGYWANNKVDSSDCIRNGWLDTGDTGWMDKAGNLWLMGRQKGRIKSGGENVYPEEVELVLSQHPGVARVVVVGIPDSRLGEKVVACVSISDGWKWVDARAEHKGEGKEVSPQILQDHCRQKKLSRFKVPRLYYQWRQPFPLTSTGKIRREELKREILATMQIPSNL